MKNANQGKRQSQYESNAKIFFVGFIFMVVVFILIAFCGKGAKAQEYGTAFLVTYQDVTSFRGTKDYKLFTFNQVDSLATEKFNHKIDSKKLMGGTNSFVIENGNKVFYAEMKYLNRKGNFKLNKRVK